MRKIRRQFTFLISGLLSIQSAFALESTFPTQATKLLSVSLGFLVTAVQNTWIQQGISLIAIIAIFYNIYDALIQKVSVFSQNSKMIAVPLAILSTLAIYYKFPAEKISKMFLILIIGVALIYIIKGLLWLAGKFKGKPSVKKAINDEKKVQKDAKEGINLENRLIGNENDLERNLVKEKYDTEKLKKYISQLESKAKSSQKDLEDISKDAKRT